MAKTKNDYIKLDKKKINKKGIHSKSKTSNLIQSKNYKKSYKGQGK